MDERKKDDLSIQDVEVVPVKKKRKKISISMILCIVFLITTGVFWSNSEQNAKSYTIIQKQYDELKSEYNSLSKELSYYKEQYKTIEQELDKQKTEIDNLKDENSEKQNQIDDLKNKNSNLKKKVNTLKEENTSLKTSSDNNESGGGKRIGYYLISDSEGTMVWLSETGSKYHSKPDCGRMNPDKARQVSKSKAESMGYGRCGNCFK